MLFGLSQLELAHNPKQLLIELSKGVRSPAVSWLEVMMGDHPPTMVNIQHRAQWNPTWIQDPRELDLLVVMLYNIGNPLPIRRYGSFVLGTCDRALQSYFSRRSFKPRDVLREIPRAFPNLREAFWWYDRTSGDLFLYSTRKLFYSRFPGGSQLFSDCEPLTMNLQALEPSPLWKVHPFHGLKGITNSHENITYTSHPESQSC